MREEELEEQQAERRAQQGAGVRKPMQLPQRGAGTGGRAKPEVSA